MNAKGMDEKEAGFVLPRFLTLIEEKAFAGISAARVEISENVTAVEAPQQGIIDITSYGNGEAVRKPGGALSIPRGECAQQSFSPVVCGASADPDQKRPAPARKCVEDHISDSPRSSEHRIPLFRRDKSQSCCGGHFHHGSSVTEDQILGFHR